MVFFNNLEMMCSQKNIKITQLLSNLKLSKSAISRWRSGVLPNGEVLIKIADYLECSVDYLLGRTDDPTWNKPSEAADVPDKKTPIIMEKHEKPKISEIMLPLYPQPASAGDRLYLFDSVPEWTNVPKNRLTEEADFMLPIRGDSMLPQYHDGDIVLVKKTPSIFEGEIGIFYVDDDPYIKKMGNGELISLNPDYDNIPLSEYNTIRCFGKVIGILDV